MNITEYKELQRARWGSGNYPPIGRLIEPAALTLVDRAGVRAGQHVLDVGVASGNVSVAAARTGARVTGLDITDAWWGEARRRVADEGLDIDLQLGDAEALAFEDESFDVVLSSFAAIFAPRHERVVAEFVRVCRPGGTIAMTAWPPESATSRVNSTLVDFLPAPPTFVTPPWLWGRPEHVERLFRDCDVHLTFERPNFEVSFASPDAYEEFALRHSGGLMAARQALEEQGRWEEARAAMRAALDETNEATDGSYRVTWEYLLIRGEKTKPSQPPSAELP